LGVEVAKQAIIGHTVWLYARFSHRSRVERGRRPGDKLHLDEVALKINGPRHWLWRAVDQHAFVVDILVQSRRAHHAAEAFKRRAVGGWDDTPRAVITDKLTGYPPAFGVRSRRRSTDVTRG
jgi:putative transposase